MEEVVPSQQRHRIEEASAQLIRETDNPMLITRHLDELISVIQQTFREKPSEINDRAMLDVIQNLEALLSRTNSFFSKKFPSWNSVRSNVQLILEILSYLFKQRADEFPSAARGLAELKLVVETRQRSAEAAS